MSSALKGYAQIPSQFRYFTTIDTVDKYVIDTPSPVISIGVIPASVATVAAGVLLKDLGRVVYAYNDLSLTEGIKQVAVFRQVMVVADFSSEGIGERFYIKVWSADGVDQACVARAGPGA
jgi:hypothetical protein